MRYVESGVEHALFCHVLAQTTLRLGVLTSTASMADYAPAALDIGADCVARCL